MRKVREKLGKDKDMGIDVGLSPIVDLKLRRLCLANSGAETEADQCSKYAL